MTPFLPKYCLSFICTKFNLPILPLKRLVARCKRPRLTASRAIAEVLRIAPAWVTDRAELANDLNADSLDMIELIMHLEEAFGIDIRRDELKNLGTSRAIVAYL